MLNWREIPFLRLLLPFLFGIVLAVHFDYNDLLLKSLPVCSFLSLLLASQLLKGSRKKWAFGLALNLFLFTSGYQIAWHHNELNDPGHFEKMELTGEAFLIGKVTEAPIKKEKWVKVTLEVRAAGTTPDSLNAHTGKLLLYLSKDSMSDLVSYGDLLTYHGRLLPTEPPKNPDAFDYRRYLHFQNIHYQAFAKEDDWAISGRGLGSPVKSLAISMQHRFVETLRKHLDTPNEFAVGTALILGYRDETPQEILTAYSQTGAMHVLAVSGLHVGIVSLLLGFLFNKIKTNKPGWKVGKVVLIVACIWAFALLTGASPSVLRATVMFSFLNVGTLLRRYVNTYNTLTLSAFCLLLFNPFWLMSVSFQLSYLAVYGIVFFMPKFRALLKLKNKALRWVWDLTSVSLGAQLMTLPLTMFYFHQFTTFFWLSSLILVPLAGFVLGLGLVLFLLDPLLPWLATIAGKVLWGLIFFCNEVIFFIQKLPAAVFEGIWMGKGMVVLLFLVLLVGMFAIGRKNGRLVLASLALLAFASFSFSFSEYQSWHTRQIVVYDLYKNSVMDFFDGRQAWSLVNKEADEKNLRFATQNHRFSLGDPKVETVFLDSVSYFTNDHWYFENNQVQFYQTRFAIVGSQEDLPQGERIKIDYLILRNSPKISIDKFIEVFDFQKVIFDSSNRRKAVEKWKEDCGQLGIDYHDVSEEGAWVLDLPTL